MNARIAIWLAATAGMVNSGGFVILGTFTSHVTGNLGRMSVDLATGRVDSALFALLLVLGFFVGSVLASLIIEGSSPRMPQAYASALIAQAALLAAFTLIAGVAPASSTRALDAQATLLCLAMGMQNSLVTRLSGAVVRTTHLTGIVTDLGIEAARWLRWHLAQVGVAPLFRGRVEPTRPVPEKSQLLATILLAFTVGALLGGWSVLRSGAWAVGVPTLATLALGLYALWQHNQLSKPS